MRPPLFLTPAHLPDTLFRLPLLLIKLRRSLLDELREGGYCLPSPAENHVYIPKVIEGLDVLLVKLCCKPVLFCRFLEPALRIIDIPKVVMRPGERRPYLQGLFKLPLGICHPPFFGVEAPQVIAAPRLFRVLGDRVLPDAYGGLPYKVPLISGSCQRR